MQKAEAFNREMVESMPLPKMPQIERDTVLSANIRTAQEAISAGLEKGDWDCVAQGAALLASFTGYYPWRSPPWEVIRQSN